MNVTADSKTQTSERLQTFTANDSGRDYVVGDVHGCFFMLEALLTRLGFDRYRDRLFSVGDLIDRGPDSERAGKYLAAPWFHAIRGNHEQMMLDAWAAPRFGGRAAWQLWEANGGGWFKSLGRRKQRELAERAAKLPYAIEITLADGTTTAALVHADVLHDSWPQTRDLLSRGPAIGDEHQLSDLVWKRTRAQSVEHSLAAGQARRVRVEGVDVIYFGHTPMPAPIASANTRWLDTGAFMGQRLSVAEIAVQGDVWSLADDLEDCKTGWRTAAAAKSDTSSTPQR